MTNSFAPTENAEATDIMQFTVEAPPQRANVRGHDPRRNPVSTRHRNELPDPATIPYGYCHCGCGTKTRVAKQTVRKKGWVRGEPVAFAPLHRPRPSVDLTERFWSSVDKRGPDNCWLWIGPRSGQGRYGAMYANSGMYYAHRFSYELHNGPLGEGMLACHRCDNPPCVNPRHLFAGTPSDNTNDMHAKGRAGACGSPGEANPRAKLAADDVRAVRCRYAAGGTTIKRLADEYGMAFSAMRSAIKGETWKNVT